MRQEQTSPSLLVLPIGLALALSMFGDLSLFAGLVTQLHVLQLSLAEVGILLSVHRLVRLPGNLLVGYLQDRFGRRWLYILGMLLAVLSTAAYGLVTGFWPLLLSRVAWGIAWALLNICGTTMALELSSEQNRGRLSGLYNTWMWAGYAVGPLVGSLLTDAVTFRPAMLICAGLTGIGLVIALWRVPETLPQAARAAKAPISAVLRTMGENLDLRDQPPANRRTFLLYAIVQFSGDGVLLATLTLLLIQRLGNAVPFNGWRLSPVAAGGIFIAGRAALAGVTSLGAGRFSDRRTSRSALAVASFIVTALSFLILALASSTLLIALGLLLNALGSGAAIALLPALLRDHTPANKLGSTMGAYAFAGDIGSTAGPVLAFPLAQWSSLAGVYGLVIVCFLAGLALFRLPRPG